MSMFHTYRKLLLALLFCGSIGSLVQLWLQPLPVQRSDVHLDYPDQVLLPTWQAAILRVDQADMHEVEINRTETSKAVDQPKIYRYQRNNQRLHVEVLYTLGYDANRFLRSVKRMPPITEVRHDLIRGNYGLLLHDKTYYLVSCIRTSGNSTVTMEQFNRSRYQSWLRPQHWWQWFRGEVALRDQYCHWLLMGLSEASLSESSEQTVLDSDTAFAVLATLWSQWFDHWKANGGFIVAE